MNLFYFRVDLKSIKGDYQLCFDNTFSYQTSKIVYFQIFVFDKEGNSDDLEYSKLTGINSADGSMQKLMQDIGVTFEVFKVYNLDHA